MSESHLSDLRKELVQQLNDVSGTLSKLNDQILQEKQKLEQLKGAVFALDLLAQRQTAEAPAQSASE